MGGTIGNVLVSMLISWHFDFLHFLAVECFEDTFHFSIQTMKYTELSFLKKMYLFEKWSDGERWRDRRERSSTY